MTPTDADTLRGHPRTAAEADGRGIDCSAAEMARDPTVPTHAQGWTQVLAAYVGRAADEQVPYSAGHLVFHQEHMMCNRLGVLPREEALLGVMAADNPGHWRPNWALIRSCLPTLAQCVYGT